jgi:hypothetical protein
MNQFMFQDKIVANSDDRLPLVLCVSVVLTFFFKKYSSMRQIKTVSRIVEYKVGQSENVNKKKLEGYGLLPMVSKTAKIFVGQITFYS